MSTNAAISGKANMEIPLQAASIDIWAQKYRLTDKAGIPVDKTVDDTYKRIAKSLAQVEPRSKNLWEEQFLWALRNGCIPAGRIISNAGAEEHKPATSTVNCVVSGTIEDSMKGILKGVEESGISLAAGCGIGYEFSTLRPRGAFVAGVGANTSGALSFMDIYDKMCFTVSSAGGRRGAQMGTLDVSHPDVIEFIKAKREDGKLRQFNLSLLITDEFIKAVNNDSNWDLVFPVNKKEADLFKDKRMVVKDWPYIGDNMVSTEDGKVVCRVYKTIMARELWDLIMESTYNYAEPGFILIDKVNNENNNWFCENIRATNPCGEQGLPPYGACLLGSINLTQFILRPFTDKAEFDEAKFTRAVAMFTRMLDNVVEINGLPLQQQRDEIYRKRRHGMGILGLGSAMAMLKMPYGSGQSLAFTEKVSRLMAITGWATGIDLAIEKGMAPIMDEEFEVTDKMMNYLSRPKREPTASGIRKGDKVKGRALIAESDYMQRVFKERPGLFEKFMQFGCRFTHHSSIAPTGTIALSLANNASNGIEPSFAHEYTRNVIKEGKAAKEAITVRSFEALLYKELYPQLPLPEYFADSKTISPKDHINVQAEAQKWVDSAISKTVNVPTEILFEEFQSVYMYAYDKGLKGCTTFRFNPEVFQGVLVTKKDLENTEYTFVLDDGSEVVLKGNEEVEYNGQTHTAANLYDALKEGYYGKH